MRNQIHANSDGLSTELATCDDENDFVIFALRDLFDLVYQ